MKQYDNYADLITFTRASSGTALRPISYGDELSPNATFDGNIDGWRALNADATVTAENNELKVVTTGISGATLDSAMTLEVGKVYFFTATSTSADVAHQVRVGTTSSTSQDVINFPQYNSPTTFTHVFVATSTVLWVYLRSGGGAGTVTWDNISVREVLFDQPDGTLTLFNHPTNIPRIEYDSDGNRLGLLVEEARTNLVTYSEDFSNAAWSGYFQKPTFVTGQLAPDGSYTAMKWNTSTTTGSGSGRSGGLAFGQGQATAGVTYTASVWLKASAPVDMSLGLTVGATTTITLTNEWVRYSYTGESVSALRLFQLNENTNEDIDIYIWGAQTEVGSFPTSYIPSNSGSTTTRSADVASIGVSEFGYNQDAGTVISEFSVVGTSTDFAYVNAFTDGSTNNMITQFRQPNTELRTGIIFGGTNATSGMNTGNTDVGDSLKFASAFSTDDIAQSLNGAAVQTDGSATVPSGISSLRIGNRDDNARPLNGHIKSIKYYPRRLTDAQLQELTS